MKFEYAKHPIDKVSADVVCVFVFNKKKKFLPTSVFSYIDEVFSGQLSKALASDGYSGKHGEIYSFHGHGKIVGSKILVIGLGDKSEFDSLLLQEAMTAAVRQFSLKTNSICVSALGRLDSKIDYEIQAKKIVEGIMFGAYDFSRKSEDERRELEVVIFSDKNKEHLSKLKKGAVIGETVAKGVYVARDLVNEQSAVATPEHLAKMAKEIAFGNQNVKCRVYETKDLKKMKMEAFLSVARGSIKDIPPKFIHLHYKPKKSSERRLAIVGKGVTFDTGGVSLKPANYMTTMKCDMAGAAAVLGLFSVISKIKPKLEVMGLIAATPNVVSAMSYLPGDIVKASNGKTIEVLNTDAEGRITMADSLSYAVEQGATEIIDLATLTGACVVALGEEYAGMFANDEELSERFEKAYIESGEKIWRLPLPESYKKLIKSPVADVANIGSTPYGGAITAALFLESFVDSKPWIHLDIAGPAFSEKDNPLGSKGGTGFGVSTLISYLS